MTDHDDGLGFPAKRLYSCGWDGQGRGKGTRTFTIWGGGYGHRSRNEPERAQQIAKGGKTYKEILNFFYSDGCEELTE